MFFSNISTVVKKNQINILNIINFKYTVNRALKLGSWKHAYLRRPTFVAKIKTVIIFGEIRDLRVRINSKPYVWDLQRSFFENLRMNCSSIVLANNKIVLLSNFRLLELDYNCWIGCNFVILCK